MINDLSYSQFTALLESKGVKRLYMKYLALNDNSKNQPYLGNDFSAVQVLPHQDVFSDNNNFKAKLDFYWLDDETNLNLAPNAQLILYPNYPEIRFSGFLKGAQNPPGNLMNGRISDRVLFFGVCDDDKIIGYVTTKHSPLLSEIANLQGLDETNVLIQLPIQVRVSPKTLLLNQLRRIHDLEWIEAKRLSSTGTHDCEGTNCGGLTLEAELGIISNSKSEPDYLGYEVKQYNVRNFNKPGSGPAITLMTPEPKGGVYKDEGVEVFIRRFGYLSKTINNRMDFSGLHYVNKRHIKTGLTLEIDGFDRKNSKITDVNGRIVLKADNEVVAAAWNFADIINHWSRKHNHAVYVPSKKMKNPGLRYCYGHLVYLAENTDPLLLLKAFADNKVYYDPGIHLDNMSSHPTTKRRSQFRINIKNISLLYGNLTQENLLLL